MQLLLILLSSLLQFASAQLSCISGSGGACPVRPLCPGDSVSYICDVDVADNTAWSFPDGTCDSMHNRIVLLHAVEECRNSTNMCGPFTVENCDPKETDQPCTVSTLNVSLSEVANGTVIQCNTSTLANNIEIGTATIVKAGKPSINASFTGCSNGSVTMQWKQDTDNEYNYVLSATPPVENCDPNCTVQSTTKYKFIGLERGMKYNLTVQASNCVGSTEERKTAYIPESSPLQWNGPMCKTYSKTSLSAIYSSWQPTPSILLNGEGLPCASVQLYVITYESDTGELLNGTVLPSECSFGECSHEFPVPVDSSASQYSVSVTAVGLGVTSDTKTVGKMNDIMLAVVNITLQPVIATCSFLSGFTGSAYCRVDYGTSPDSLEYSATSQQMGSAGESVTVELTLNGATFPPSTTYYYTATPESLCVKVEGQFTTGQYNCSIADLEATASDSSECGEGEMAADIPNGVLCYTGLMPGSTATYSCDDGSSVVLECISSGQWNGTAPACGAGSGGGLSTGAIVSIAIGMPVLTLLLLLVLIVIAAYSCYKEIELLALMVLTGWN